MHHKHAKYQFWRWFEHNHKKFLELHKKTEKDIAYWTNEMKVHLAACGRYIDFGLHHHIDEGISTLTISAKGKSNYFKQVDDFVALAPEIPHWKIEALVPPYGVGGISEFVFEETGLDVQELFVDAIEWGKDEPVDIIFYSPMYRKEEMCIFMKRAIRLLVALIGERRYGLEIGHEHMDNLSNAPEGVELIKLLDFPDWLENRDPPFVVDSSGHIRRMVE